MKKADKWRRLIAIAPVILWVSWRDEDDQLLHGMPPIPANAANRPEHDRSYQSIYRAALQLATSVRILASCKISMSQVRSGQEFLIQYNRALKQMGIHTTINNHLSTHYVKFFERFGPVYGWWLFPFERFNGMLEKVKHNGHDGGRMELTMMRNWIMMHLLYEYLLHLPDDPQNSHERELLEATIRREGQQQRGGMMTELAIYHAEAFLGNNITLPRRTQRLIDVSTILPDALSYTLMLRYLRNLWPDLNLVSDTTIEEGTPFYRSKYCRPLLYIKKDGIRYGSLQNKATSADSKAFILGNDGYRQPVEILSLLAVQIGDMPSHVCAFVHKMHRDARLPPFPWDLQYVTFIFLICNNILMSTFSASTLGIHITYANEFDEPEIIPVSQIDSTLATIPFRSQILNCDLWAHVSFDRVSIHLVSGI